MGVAEQALKQAVALGGTQPDLHFNLGVMAEQRGQRAVAAPRVPRRGRGVSRVDRGLGEPGLLERQAGRVDAALEAFERAASAKADAMEGPYLLAETLASLGTASGRGALGARGGPPQPDRPARAAAAAAYSGGRDSFGVGISFSSSER